uniref:ZZ-type domain-containing protein n=1 Tax=Macrostomum lignano TaxID=282301 RepID=A0A1I8H7R0_9PLAT
NPTTSSSASSGRIRPSVHLSSDQTETAGPTTSGMSNSPNRAVRVLDLANSGAKTRKDRRIWEDVVNSGAAAGGKSRTSRSKRPDPRGEDESDTVSQAPMSQPINSLLSASTSQQSQASTSGAGPQGGELAPEAPDQAVDETRSTESKPQPSLAVQRLQQALELSLQEEQLETELESQRQELAELRLRVQEMQQTLENKEAAMKQKVSQGRPVVRHSKLQLNLELLHQRRRLRSRPRLLPPPPAEPPCSFDATGPVSASASSPVDEATLQVIRSIIRSEQSRDLTFAEMDRLVAERLSAQAANSSTATGDAPADNNDNDGDDSDDEESTAAPPAAKRPRTSAAEPNDTNNVSSTFACIARSLQQAGVVKSEKSTDITSSSTTNIPTTVSRNGEKENKKQKDKNVKVEADSDDVIVVDLDIRNKLKSNNNNNKSSDSAATIGAAVASVAGTSKSSSRRQQRQAVKKSHGFPIRTKTPIREQQQRQQQQQQQQRQATAELKPQPPSADPP